MKEEITIKIKKGGGGQKGGKKSSKKSLMPTAPRRSVLKRRVKNEQFIRFFDCGYYKENGVWKNLEFLYQKSDISYYDYITLVNLILTKIDLFKNTGDAITDFKTEFQSDGYFPAYVALTTNPNDFGYSITDSLLPENDPRYNQKWSRAGLKLSDNELSNEILISGIYHENEILLRTNKITKILDYDAPAVVFTPSKKFDVFFIPRIGIYLTYAIFGGFNAPPPIENPDLQIIGFQNMLYDKQSVDYRKSFRGSWNYFGGNRTSYAIAYERALRMERYGINTAQFVANSTAFPPPPAYVPNVGVYGQGLSFIFNSFDQPENFPLAILKQDSQIFFVWS